MEQHPSALGLAIVLSYDYAGHPKLPQLKGTKTDGDSMESTCKQLGFAVVRRHNIKQISLINLLVEAGQTEYPNSYRRLIFAFSGHGEEGGRLCTCDRDEIGRTVTVDVGEIIHSLSVDGPSSSSMARIFFFDACRGNCDDHGRMRPKGGEAVGIRVPESANNLLVAYATVEGYRAYEVGGEGEEGGRGIWMSLLAEKLLQEDKTVYDVLTAVNIEMSSLFQDSQAFPVMQQPELTARLREDVNLLREYKNAREFVMQMHIDTRMQS